MIYGGLIKTVKSCVLPFTNGIRVDERPVSDFYQKPTMQIDLNEQHIFYHFSHKKKLIVRSSIFAQKNFSNDFPAHSFFTKRFLRLKLTYDNYSHFRKDWLCQNLLEKF